MESVLMSHIVLVEDDARLRTLVKDFLQQHHFDVTAMADGSLPGDVELVLLL